VSPLDFYCRNFLLGKTRAARHGRRMLRALRRSPAVPPRPPAARARCSLTAWKSSDGKAIVGVATNDTDVGPPPPDFEETDFTATVDDTTLTFPGFTGLVRTKNSSSGARVAARVFDACAGARHPHGALRAALATSPPALTRRPRSRSRPAGQRQRGPLHRGQPGRHLCVRPVHHR
jgi:hypothetical protein